MEQKYYICKHCGNIYAAVKQTKVPVMCCGAKMEEIIPGTVEASLEKHIPVYKVEGNIVTVTVGSVEHPMQDVHYIEWIILETNLGYHQAKLNPSQKPEATFVLNEGEEVVKAYEYCNLHSLWATK